MQRGDELRRAGTAAIGVVPELSGGDVVHDAIVRIVPGVRTGGGIEARITARETARCADRRHDLAIHPDHVRPAGKVGNHARVCAARSDVEDEVIAASATAQRVVAAGASQRIVAIAA